MLGHHACEPVHGLPLPQTSRKPWLSLQSAAVPQLTAPPGSSCGPWCCCLLLHPYSSKAQDDLCVACTVCTIPDHTHTQSLNAPDYMQTLFTGCNKTEYQAVELHPDIQTVWSYLSPEPAAVSMSTSSSRSASAGAVLAMRTSRTGDEVFPSPLRAPREASASGTGVSADRLAKCCYADMNRQ